MPWIFDAIPRPDRETVEVVLLSDGGISSVEFPYRPSLYVLGSSAERVAASVDGVDTCWRRMKHLMDGEVEVLEIRAPFERAVSLARAIDFYFSDVEVFNADIEISQRFLAERGLFPLAEVGSDLHLLNDLWDLHYDLPDMRVLHIAPPAGWRWKGFDRIRVDGRWVPLRTLQETFESTDPDVLIVDEGDDLLPLLQRRSPLDGLNRLEPVRREGSGRSLFSYGRPVYRPAPFHLAGRLHIPGGFLHRESGLEGLIEVARLSSMPLQRLARTSPGTAISAMQVNLLLDREILVPWKKNVPEKPKSMKQLLRSDRGGFIFDPIVGFHEQVWELDFSSMYPTIMVKHNISPETVLCNCGDDEVVPEIGYRICRRRIGVIPQVLAPLIERRSVLKREGERKRADALKWLLVTSFGYTGYRNAKLGCIEAHEAINAYGREYMLRSAEIAASMGFQVIHGIVDSLWVTGSGDPQKLAGAISREIGIPMAIEGAFRWMVFLPGRHGGVALNRFYGVHQDGRLKVRGLALRRRDTPPLVAKTQMKALTLLASSRDEASFLDRIPEVLDLYRGIADRLRSGDVEQDDLVICRLIYRRAWEYHTDTHLLAALRAAGCLHPGQTVEYIVVRSSPPEVVLHPSDHGYDVSFYTGLLARSAEELLRPFGWTVEKLRLHLCRSAVPQ